MANQYQFQQSGTVGGEIRAELARQRMSGREFARRLNRSRMYVARRLSGEVPWTADELPEVAHVLGVPVGAFYHGEAVMLHRPTAAAS